MICMILPLPRYFVKFFINFFRKKKPARIFRKRLYKYTVGWVETIKCLIQLAACGPWLLGTSPSKRSAKLYHFLLQVSRWFMRQKR